MSIDNANASKPKFALGQVVATPGAIDLLATFGVTPHELLSRHVRGDWGDVCPEDAALNDEALKDGSRLLSAYVLKLKKSIQKVWLITEAEDDDGHRAVTTILRPEDY